VRQYAIGCEWDAKTGLLGIREAPFRVKSIYGVGVVTGDKFGATVGGTPPSGVAVGVGMGKAMSAVGDLHESKSGPMSSWNAIGLFSVGWLITRSGFRLNTRSS